MLDALGDRRKSTYDSRPAGDIVLAHCPPYLSRPWLAAGLPFLSAILERGGITSRIVRLLEDPFSSPISVVERGRELQWLDPPLSERLSHIRQIAEHERGFFAQILSRLLAGPERVFGFSVWRPNVDIVLEVTRQLKLQRPDAFVVLGGPEANESPFDLRRDWIDAVITGLAEGVIEPVARAFLNGEPATAAIWENVWLNPRHGGDVICDSPRKPMAPAIPKVDYSTIVPMMLDDADARIPVLLNVGCPFRCTFCTNTNFYPELEWGETQRLVEEMGEIMRVWHASFPEGEAPPLGIQLCDAAANGKPAQFDDLCRRLTLADWPLRPQKISVMLILDGRVTPERAKLWAEVGCLDLTFGLESAAPRIRREIKKPGTLESVRQALCTMREYGTGRLRVTTGIIVGFPDETEADFYETIAFLDWMCSLGILDSIHVTPLRRTDAMMDQGVLKDAAGPRVALTWTLPTAGGSPSVRARRFLSVFEHFHGVVHVMAAAPPSFIVRHLLNEDSSVFWSRWASTRPENGSADTARPSSPDGTREISRFAGAPTAARSSRFFEETERSVCAVLKVSSGKTAMLGWSARMATLEEDPNSCVVEFANEGRRVVLLLKPRSEDGRVHRRTARFNVGYLPQWNGQSCDVDDDLVDCLLREIERIDGNPPGSDAHPALEPSPLSATVS